VRINGFLELDRAPKIGPLTCVLNQGLDAMQRSCGDTPYYVGETRPEHSLRVIKPCFLLSMRNVAQRYGSRHTGDERHARRYPIDGDSDRNTLCQPYPRVDGVNTGETLSAGRRVGHADTSSDRRHVADDRGRITHQLDLGTIPNAHLRQLCLLEIAIHPEAIGIDDRNVATPPRARSRPLVAEDS
jgi:hypothetical protein